MILLPEMMIASLKNIILSGGSISDEQVIALADYAGDPGLREAAKEITKELTSSAFDSCSIINARSGRCGENCKWCAQSSHYNTHCDVYDLVDEDECLRSAKTNKDAGVHRFSLVASGKATRGPVLDKICSMLRRIKDEVGIFTCASLGLLSSDELQKLWDAGVRRYHCNLEAAPGFFSSLCSTHTVDDKIKTILAAKEIGFEICSGGIIGMGENMRQRAELAVALRKVNPVSIPVNILCPIKGTPLENARPLSADEILDTLAIFRFAHPTVQIRFAGGRRHLTAEQQIEAMSIAVNGAIVGDLLTTVGSTIDSDRHLIEKTNLKW